MLKKSGQSSRSLTKAPCSGSPGFSVMSLDQHTLQNVYRLRRVGEFRKDEHRFHHPCCIAIGTQSVIGEKCHPTIQAMASQHTSRFQANP